MEPYFKLRSKSNKKDFHQIQLIYLHGGKEKRLGTGRSVPSKYWNRKEERITAKAKEIDIDYIEINKSGLCAGCRNTAKPQKTMI